MWEAQNLPSIENMNEKAMGVAFEFMSYDYPEIKKIGSFLAAREYLSVKPSQESWENLNESLLNHKYFGKLLANNNFLDKKVAPIISSANSSSDKVKQIIPRRIHFVHALGINFSPFPRKKSRSERSRRAAFVALSGLEPELF